MLRSKSLVLLAFLFFFGIASAQITSATINGKVFDGEQPVSNASIRLIYLPTNSVYETVTDKKGRFSLDNLDVGGPFKIEVTGETIEQFSKSGLQLSLGENDLPKPILVRKKETEPQNQMVSTTDKNSASKSS